MAISQPRERVINLETATGTVTGTYEPHPAATQVTLFSLFTQPGTLTISRVATDGSSASIGTQAVVANTAAVTTFAYNTGPLLLSFAATSTAGTGYVEAQYAGHAGGLS